MSVSPCVCLHMCGRAQRGQKVLDTLELEFQIVVSHLVHTGHWTLVLCNSSKHPPLLSCLSSPSLCFPESIFSWWVLLEFKGTSHRRANYSYVDSESVCRVWIVFLASDWRVCLSLRPVPFWSHCASAFPEAHLFLSLTLVLDTEMDRIRLFQ